MEHHTIDKMKFKILTLETTKLANIPNELLPFRWVTHHVKEIFMALLPNIEINGSSKIEISFGSRGDEVIFDNVLGVTNFFIEDFDFLKFYSLTKNKQDIIIIEAIKDSLLAINKSQGNDLSVVNAIIMTANDVIHSDFKLQIPINRLGKKSSDKNYEVSVIRNLSAEVGEAWSCLIKNKKTNLISEKWITKVPDYLDRIDYFKTAEIKKDVYTIFNSFGKQVFQSPLSFD